MVWWSSHRVCSICAMHSQHCLISGTNYKALQHLLGHMAAGGCQPTRSHQPAPRQDPPARAAAAGCPLASWHAASGGACGKTCTVCTVQVGLPVEPVAANIIDCAGVQH